MGQEQGPAATKGRGMGNVHLPGVCRSSRSSSQGSSCPRPLLLAPHLRSACLTPLVFLASTQLLFPRLSVIHTPPVLPHTSAFLAHPSALTSPPAERCLPPCMRRRLRWRWRGASSKNARQRPAARRNTSNSSSNSSSNSTSNTSRVCCPLQLPPHPRRSASPTLMPGGRSQVWAQVWEVWGRCVMTSSPTMS